MAELSGYDSEIYHSSEPEYNPNGCSSSYCSSDLGNESSQQLSLSRCSSDMSESLVVMSGYIGQDDDFESSDSSVMEPSPDACTSAWDSDNAFVLNDSKDTDMSEVPSDHSDGNANSPEEFLPYSRNPSSCFMMAQMWCMILIFQYALK